MTLLTTKQIYIQNFPVGTKFKCIKRNHSFSFFNSRSFEENNIYTCQYIFPKNKNKNKKSTGIRTARRFWISDSGWLFEKIEKPKINLLEF